MDEIETPKGTGERLPLEYTTFGTIDDLNPFFATYLKQLPEGEQVAAKALARDELVARYEDRYITWMNGMYAQMESR